MLNIYYSKVTSKGQITIPTIVRHNLHIVTGNRVELIQKDNCVVVVPINGSLSKLKKSLPKPDKILSCDEMNNIIANKGNL